MAGNTYAFLWRLGPLFLGMACAVYIKGCGVDGDPMHDLVSDTQKRRTGYQCFMHDIVVGT